MLGWQDTPLGYQHSLDAWALNSMVGSLESVAPSAVGWPAAEQPADSFAVEFLELKANPPAGMKLQPAEGRSLLVVASVAAVAAAVAAIVAVAASVAVAAETAVGAANVAADSSEHSFLALIYPCPSGPLHSAASD